MNPKKDECTKDDNASPKGNISEILKQNEE